MICWDIVAFGTSTHLPPKDEGVYTYIDENAATVARTTRLNNPDVILSEEQNDIIHNVALKQLQGSRFAVDAEKVITAPVQASLAAASASVGSLPTPMLLLKEKVEAEVDDMNVDDEDSSCLDPQPFTSLFQRMAKPSDSKKRANQGSGAGTGSTTSSGAAAKKAKGNTGTAVQAQRNKRAKAAGKEAGDEDVPMGELFAGLDTSNDQGREDASLIESYVNQLKELKCLNASGSDDQTFGPWSRARLQKLQELKAGIKGKSKSISRRKDDSTEVRGALDEIVGKINDVMDFIKKLAAGNSEGRKN